MSKSPGHRQWPEHNVIEQNVDRKVKVSVEGENIAISADVIKVEEDDCPDRYYFPRADVYMDKLEPSATTSECPFKGKATYYNLNTHEGKIIDAVWSYEDPYEEHRALKGMLAFYDDKIPQITIAAG